MRTYRGPIFELLGLDDTIMAILERSNERFSHRWQTEDQSHLRGREYAQPWWMRSLFGNDHGKDDPPADPGSDPDGAGLIARADALRVYEGATATARTVLANDKAASDRLFVAKVNGTEIGSSSTQITLASGAIVTMHRDGRYTYDQNGAFEHVPAADQAIDSFQYTVSNGRGETATATVTITITGINDTPSVQNVTGSAEEDGPAVSISAIYSDVDTGDTHQFGVQTSGTAGSVQNNSDGSFTYDPNGAFDSLAEGETATDTFRYWVSDGNGVLVFRTATITITGANDDPVVEDVARDVSEDAASDLVAADFTDADTSDTHTFTIDTTGTAGLVANNGDGTFTYDPAGGFDFLAAGEIATDSFTYTVDDGHGGVSTGVITITIHGADEII